MNFKQIQHRRETCISWVNIKRYLKLTDTRIPPSYPFWKGWILQFPRRSKSNFNSSNKALCEQVIKLRPEASHEVKINLHIIKNHNMKHKLKKLCRRHKVQKVCSMTWVWHTQHRAKRLLMKACLKVFLPNLSISLLFLHKLCLSYHSLIELDTMKSS